MDARILIVEDDATIRTLLEMALIGAEYSRVESVARGDQALPKIREFEPDLVLLDLMLPGLDGYAIASAVRADPKLAATRIIMLTARTASEDIVRGLNAGADDYVTKPYERTVLLARVKAVLRRGLPVSDGVDFDGLTVSELTREAHLHGRRLELTAGEFSLLLRMLAHRGRIFVRPPDERTIDVQVANLRKQLGDWAEHIETVRGVGYRIAGIDGNRDGRSR